MDLLCFEAGPVLASDDPVMAEDRILANLLRTEEKYQISYSYFKTQKELKTWHRRVVCQWMLEITEIEKCSDTVFPMASQLLDRALTALSPIRKSQLQLLASVCLLLASKMRQTRPLSAEKLVYYTDYSIGVQELLTWELLVLSKLRWDLAAITPNDFVNPILRRLHGWTKGQDMMIKNHASTFIALAAADFKFSMYTPSMVAAASISTAILGLRCSGTAQWQSQQKLLHALNEITGIEIDCLRECQKQIEAMIASHTPPSPNNAQEAKAAESVAGQPETPTDVQDVEC